MARNYRDPRGHTQPMRSRDGRAPTEREVMRQAVSRPRKRQTKPHVSVAAVIVIGLILAVVASCIFVIVRYDRPQDSRRSEIVNNLYTGTSDETHEPFAEETKFVSVLKSSEDVHRGNLILVNYNHEYVFPESEERLVSVYEYKTPHYSVAYNYYLIDTRVINYLNGLMRELYEETGDTCIMVNSAYRDYDTQLQIYNDYVASSGQEYADKYVMDPGFSEHHTGLSVDLTVRYSDGTGVVMEQYENLDTLNELCVKHGFVQRYEDNKYEYTQINTEPWHYRYVGYPHSAVMDSLDLCLEEYVDYVKSYTAEGEVIYLSENGEVSSVPSTELPEDGYVIYYTSEATEGETSVPIPEGETSYGISGNNVDGFIVHVEIGGGK